MNLGGIEALQLLLVGADGLIRPGAGSRQVYIQSVGCPRPAVGWLSHQAKLQAAEEPHCSRTATVSGICPHLWRVEAQGQAGAVWDHLEVGDGGAQAVLPAVALGAGGRGAVSLQLEMRGEGMRQARPFFNDRSFNFPLAENVLISPLLLKASFTGTQCLYFSFCRDYAS